MRLEAPTALSLPHETSRASVDSPSRLRIATLGGFSVAIDDQPVQSSAWQYRATARTVLKLLAIHPSHRLHREQIIDQLWPDAEAATADGSMRKAIHALRRALEPDLASRQPSSYILAKGQLLELSADRVEVDLDRFERLARDARSNEGEASYEEAISAYGGDLLPEDRYEDWADVRRAELRSTYRDLMLELSGIQQARGALSSATENLRRVLLLDSSDEDIHRRLMVLYARSGNHHAALRQYRDCARALEQDLGVEPSAETQALYGQLRERTLGPEPPADLDRPLLPQRLATPPRIRMVGRVEVTTHLREGLEAAENGSGSVYLIGGEGGVGKSRLASEVAGEAFARNWTVIWGTGYQEERLVPYSIVKDALSAVLATLPETQSRSFRATYTELATLLESTGAVQTPPTQSQEAERTKIQRGFTRFLDDISRDRPLALMLDDLHCADPASLRLLQHVARLARQKRWLVLGTYREDQLGDSANFGRFSADLTKEGLSRRVDLRGLSRAETAELAMAVLEQAENSESRTNSDIQTDAVFDATLGNPLFITELLQDPAWVGWQSKKGGRTQELPQGIRELVEDRMAGLSRDTRGALSLAAVAGMHSSFALLQMASTRAFDPPLTEARLIESLDEALNARLLEEQEVGTSWGYAFRHPLIQAGLYDALSRRRRMQLHRCLAEAIEATNPDEIEALAHHYSHSDDGDSAIRYLKAAITRAISLYANETAEAYLRDLIPRLDASRSLSDAAEARSNLGRVLMTMARYEEAEREAEQAATSYAAQGDISGEISAVALLAHIAGERGQPLAGLERAERVVPRIEECVRPEDVASFLFVMARLHFLSGQYSDMMLQSLRLKQVAETITEGMLRATTLAQAESCIGTAHLMVGEPEPGFAALQKSIALAEEAGDLETLSRSVSNLAAGHADAARFDEARSGFVHALEVAERVGDPTKIAWQMCVLANTESMLGNWKECRRLLEGGLTLLREIGDTWYIAYPLVQLAAQELSENDVPSARALLAEAMPFIEQTGDMQVLRWAQGRLAEADLVDGDPAAARERLRAVLDRPGMVETDVNHLLPILARAELHFDVDEAIRLTDEGIERAREQDDVVALIESLRIRGEAARASGEMEEAERYLSEGLNLSQTSGYLPAEAAALLELGDLHSRTGDTDKAAEELSAATAIFGRLGAPVEVERAESLLAGLVRAATTS